MVKTVVIIGILMLVFSSGMVIKDWGSDGEDVKIISEDEYETDYESLVHFGLAPNTKPREPDQGDIDTEVVGSYEGTPVRLYASRTWANNDYGKTFLWRDS